MPKKNDDIEMFKGLCFDAQKAWKVIKAFSSDNSYLDTMSEEDRKTLFHFHGELFGFLGDVLQRHFLLTISKLHDSSGHKGQYNLSIEYMIEKAEPEKKEKLKEIKKKLDGFYEKIKPARHKIIAHYDYDTIKGGKSYGGFDIGEDEEYFKALQEFYETVSGKFEGELVTREDGELINLIEAGREFYNIRSILIHTEYFRAGEDLSVIIKRICEKK